MKVLHIFSGQEFGGILTLSSALIIGCKNRGIDVEALSLRDNDLAKMLRSSGIKTSIVKKRSRLDLTLIPQLSQFIANNDINIVHSHGIAGNFYSRLAARSVKNIGHVTTVHSDTKIIAKNSHKSLVAHLPFYIDLKMQALSDALMPVSDDIYRKLLRRGVSSEKIYLIMTGLDRDIGNRYAKTLTPRSTIFRELGLTDNDRPIIMNNQRLLPIKDQATLIKAIPSLKGDYPRIKVVFIGDGPELKRLIDLADRLGVSDNVAFAGWKPDALPFLNIADIAIYTSKYESISIAVLEAMYLRKPIIAADTGSLPDMIKHKSSGIIFKQGDVDELAKNVKLLLEDRGAAKAYGESAYQDLVYKFSEDKMIEDTINVYRKVNEIIQPAL